VGTAPLESARVMTSSSQCDHRVFSKTWRGEDICAFCGVFVSVVASEQKSRLRLRSIRVKSGYFVHAGRYLGYYYTEHFSGAKGEKHIRLNPIKCQNYFATRIVST